MLAALALLLGPFLGDDAAHWGERSLRLDALPADLPPGARAALEAWHAFALEHEYRLDLDPRGRVLLVTRRSNERVPAQLELAAQVIELFDRELPAPAVRLEAAAPKLAARAPPPAPPPREDAPVPEDPEGPDGDHPWTLEATRPAPVTSSAPEVTTWGSQGAPLDTQTVVLFVLTDQDDFERLLARLAEAFPFLEPWTLEAKALHGYVLGDPLTAAYLENPPGVDEWNPDHELVNRLARLCLLRRFGELPNWLVQGYAWHVEIALKGAIYVFPWRDEFVWATEHTGWEKIVRERYQRERPKPSEFMAWRRGAYRDPEAKASWGMCEYLLAKERAKLPELLDRLRVFREEHGRIQDDPRSWRRDVGYEIPVADQQALFVAALGAGYLDRAGIYFRQELGR
jgi:hypothetical protein